MFADCASYGERVTSLRTVLQHVGARVEVWMLKQCGLGRD